MRKMLISGPGQRDGQVSLELTVVPESTEMSRKRMAHAEGHTARLEELTVAKGEQFQQENK